MPKDPCSKLVSDASDGRLNESDSDQLLLQMKNLAEERVRKTGKPFNEALSDIAGEVKSQDKLMLKIYERNQLLSMKVKDRIKDLAKRFPTIGEGLRAYLEGSPKKIEGARNSVDYNAKAVHGKYFGRLISDLEDAGVLGQFRRGELAKEIYQEMGELGKENGKPGVSGSDIAMKIAKTIEGTTAEMVARQNRAGSFIMKLPGYIVRQTHDMTQVRLAGGEGMNKASKEQSFKTWMEFTLPLLDNAKTFQGADPVKSMRNIHEGIYTGVHGPNMDSSQSIGNFFPTLDIGNKTSKSRVLHFKDAESAFKYNEEFGIKHIRDQVFSDLWYRSRNIALMEGLGPNPEATWERAKTELAQESRSESNSAEHADSLKDWKLDAAFNTVTGKNDIPANFSLSRAASTFRNLVQLAKMGSVTVMKSLGDKAFLQSEMAYQGISQLKTFTHSLMTILPRSAESQKMLRLMGVAMDGLIGNTASRYTMHNTVSGLAHSAQRTFYDVNLMNWWTDTHKAAAAELMAGHLGEHAELPFEKLPPDLQKVLPLYDISPTEWDAIRNTSWVNNETGHKFVTPDMLKNIPQSSIDALITNKELKVTDANRERMRDDLETKLRTYISDRVDVAIPTPGAAERKYVTLNTQSGTPLGEAVRLLTMFKSFPITIMNKLISRDVYGNGSQSVGQWLLNDHRGKFNMAQMIAMTFMAGYVGGAIKDSLRGRTPKPLVDEGKIQWNTVNDAMIHGGGVGIMGDFLLNEYDSHYRGFLSQAAGPVFGELDQLGDAYTKMKNGDVQGALKESGKLTLDNTPYLNLFYIRPILDYFVLWNLQEMTDPGSLEKMENSIMKRNHQDFFVRPSEVVRK